MCLDQTGEIVIMISCGHDIKYQKYDELSITLTIFLTSKTITLVGNLRVKSRSGGGLYFKTWTSPISVFPWRFSITICGSNKASNVKRYVAPHTFTEYSTL